MYTTDVYFVCCVSYSCYVCFRKGTYICIAYCHVGHVHIRFLYDGQCTHTYGAKHYYLPCILKVYTFMYLLHTPVYVLCVATIIYYRIVPFLEYV